MKSKILIIGPFEDNGGREIDTAFLALSLSKDFDVTICSTGNITSKSQIYTTDSQYKVTSLKKKLFFNHFILKPATIFSYFKNKMAKPIYFYVNNKFNIRLDYKKKEFTEIQKLIKNVDLVFIRAHIYTNKLREVIDIASALNKKIIFRTTGAMEKRKSWPDYLNNVDLFIHHSQANSDNLHSQLSTKYTIIDQSAMWEEQLLKIPILSGAIKNFAVIGRLSPEKNILNLISFFKQNSSAQHHLYIVGGGELASEIKASIDGQKNITLMGSVSATKIADIYRDIDCLILSSYCEAGPLVGVEAMAAGKIILSTKVGAMPERLENTLNNFWFEPPDKTSFKKQFERIKKLSPLQAQEIANINRETYLKKYSRKRVSEEYLNWITRTLNNN